MRCQHGKGPARECSQCIGIKPHVVSVIDHRLCIDGEPTSRNWDAEPRHVTARRRARK